MTTFAARIRPAVNAELRAAMIADNSGQSQVSFSHLERAHVLGQASTVQHVRVHLRMRLSQHGMRHRPWLAIDDRSWLYRPFTTSLFLVDGLTGLTERQAVQLATRLRQLA